MRRNVIRRGVLLLTALLAGGCSDYGAGMQGARMAMNLSKKDTHLRIFLDGQRAEQNTAKKAMTGYSNWKIKEPVSTSPRLRFEIEDADKLGRITMVTVSIYQAFEADYSHQAEYTLVSRSQSPDAQMKPGEEYPLGSPGGDIRVIGLTGSDVGGVTLKPGVKYKLVLTVKADKSESAQIEFKTS